MGRSPALSYSQPIADTLMRKILTQLSKSTSRLFRRRPLAYYLLNLRAILVYKNFLKDFIFSFVLDFTHAYPRTVTIRSKHQNLTLYASNHGDMMTINEIFVWQCYPYESLHNDIILDLGSNTGISTAFFLSTNPYSKVIQYEPNTQLSEYQQLNLKAFPTNRFTTYSAAIGPLSGTGTLQLSHHSRYTSINLSTPIDSTKNVEVYSLESIIRDAYQVHGSCDVLKIDIEGYGYISLDSIPLNFPILPRIIYIEEEQDSALSLGWLKANYSCWIHPSGIHIYSIKSHEL
jgi:FkbM family methyltransferase